MVADRAEQSPSAAMVLRPVPFAKDKQPEASSTVLVFGLSPAAELLASPCSGSPSSGPGLDRHGSYGGHPGHHPGNHGHHPSPPDPDDGGTGAGRPGVPGRPRPRSHQPGPAAAATTTSSPPSHHALHSLQPECPAVSPTERTVFGACRCAGSSFIGAPVSSTFQRGTSRARRAGCSVP